MKLFFVYGDKPLLYGRFIKARRIMDVCLKNEEDISKPILSEVGNKSTTITS